MKGMSLLLAALTLAGCETGENRSSPVASLPSVVETLTAWAGATAHARAGQGLTFRAHFTGPVILVQWDFDDDGTVDSTRDLSQGPLEEATHTYSTPGTREVLLRVADTRGNIAEARRTVVVLDSATDVVLGRFGPYFNLPGASTPAASASYNLDPAKAANLSRFTSLTGQQQARLKQDGFTVRATTSDQMHAIYTDALASRQALFITSDSLLHTFHELASAALRRCEEDHLMGDLRQMVDALLARTNWQRQRASAAAVRALLERNLAYLGVASTLLGRTYALPLAAQKLVQAELALINAHRGHAVSPLFLYKEDYGQYRPRGHYDRGEEPRRYYRAMTWLGRMAFRLSPPTEEGGAARGRDETLQALLLTQALHTTAASELPASALWERIHEPTAFFRGRADDITPRDYAMLLAKIHGATWRWLSPDELAEPARLGLLVDQAKKLRDLQSSAFAWQVQQSKDAPYTRGMRLLGRRFLPDEYILKNLVYPAVLQGDNKRRTLPRGLDVMATLGSQRASEVLDQVHGVTVFPNYVTQVSNLRAALATLTPYDRVQSLPWAWLHALTPLMETPGSGYPAFMRTLEWRDKQLNSALGAWTELRHDTTPLTVGQSAPPGTSSPVVPVVYVEPVPRVYARLHAMARMLRLGLQAHGLGDQDVSSRLSSLETTAQRLHQYGLDELAGKDLTVVQMDSLRDFGQQLRKLTTFSANAQYPGRRRMAHVVTLGVDASGSTRQEAVGDPMDILVLVPRGGQVLLARGAVYSYYELTRAPGTQLSDDSWLKLLADTSQAPARPAWIFQ